MKNNSLNVRPICNRLNPFNTDAPRASAVEVASEVCEEIGDRYAADYKTNLSSPSEPSEASEWRRRDLVSMCVLFNGITVSKIVHNVRLDHLLFLSPLQSHVSTDDA